MLNGTTASQVSAVLDRELASAEARFGDRNPQSQALHARAVSVMPGGNTRTALHLSPFPLYVTRSEGCEVEDADGHRYLDVLGEYTAGLYGHSEPVIVEAVQSALARGFSNGASGEGELRLAELLCARFPSLERVRFCNSGTEATLYAVSLARLHTGRPQIMAMGGAYHGGVFAFAEGAGRINAPYEVLLAPYNDAEAARAMILENAQSLAAVLVEPMLSNGGCLRAEIGFLSALREACDQTGVLLIFDEIVTSRMAAGGAQARLGVRPDLTTLGKYMGGGFSFGAFGGRADLLAQMDPFAPRAVAHAGTFNNNVFSMAAGAAALENLFTGQRAERLFDDGERLRARLNQAAAKIAPKAQFTGWGSLMNVHFTQGALRAPEDLAHEPKGLLRLFHLDLLEAGIHAAPRGQINLSLPMGETEFDLIVQAVGGALERRAGLIEQLC